MCIRDRKLGRHPSSVGVGEVGAPGRADDGEAGLALARGQRLDSERVYLQTRGDGEAGGKGRVTRGALATKAREITSLGGELFGAG